MATKKKIRNNIDQILKWDFEDMSQAEFAARIGENRTHFNKICIGEVEPGVLKAIKIAKELGKTVEEVWPY